MSTFEEKLDQIWQRIENSCAKAGRSPDEVNMVAVSKKKTPEQIAEAAAAGFSIFGENRVQEAKQKIPLCPGGLEWHMIGHLQTNKVRNAVAVFSMIHSVDSVKLLQAINSESANAGKVMPVCLEVNVSGELSKQGFSPAEVPEVLEQCGNLMNVDVVGLMTMPPFSPDPEDAREHFVKLRERRDEWSSESGFDLAQLSMGMSNDFEVAVEEGATWIRLGTILFG